MLTLVLVVLGTFLFMLGLWQLDHSVAPFIWNSRPDQKIEIIRLPHFGVIRLERAKFYVLCYISIILGWALSLVWAML
jgi:hypothetical protein